MFSFFFSHVIWQTAVSPLLRCQTLLLSCYKTDLLNCHTSRKGKRPPCMPFFLSILISSVIVFCRWLPFLFLPFLSYQIFASGDTLLHLTGVRNHPPTTTATNTELIASLPIWCRKIWLQIFFFSQNMKNLYSISFLHWEEIKTKIVPFWKLKSHLDLV